MLGNKYLKIDSIPVVSEPRLGNTDIITTLESVERATYIVSLSDTLSTTPSTTLCAASSAAIFVS